MGTTDAGGAAAFLQKRGGPPARSEACGARRAARKRRGRFAVDTLTLLCQVHARANQEGAPPSFRPLPMPPPPPHAPNDSAPILCDTKYFYLARFLTPLALAALAELLFRDKAPGLSLGIFALLLAAFAHFHRRHPLPPKTAAAAGILLAGATLQSAVETSFSNGLVLGSLSLWLVGELTDRASPPDARWLTALRSLFRAPAQWIAVPRRFLARDAGSPAGAASLLAGRWAFHVILPSLAILLPFWLLLAGGNLVLGHFSEELWQATWRLLQRLELPSLGHLLFWMAWATLGLALLHPALPRVRKALVAAPPRLPPPSEERYGAWRIGAILVLLNAVFAVANTLDALYLWVRLAPPPGTTFSEALHAGVHLLVLAVLLSAVVLVVLREKSPVHSRLPLLRGLSLLWIAQNLVLTAGVLRRLQLYVDAYQLSVQRVEVAFFLALVAIGFVLLAAYLVRDRSFRWLVAANAAATFGLFYLLQFLPLENWVARSNVERWLRDPSSALDTAYLSRLGPAAWPALARAAGHPALTERTALLLNLRHDLPRREALLAAQPWPSWQWRPRRLCEQTRSQLDLP